MIIRTLMFCATALMTGCSSTPISVTDATPVAKERQTAFHAATAGSAPIIVTRDRGFYGAGCDIEVSINGKVAAKIRTGEKVTLHVPAGEVIVGSQPSACTGHLTEVSARLVAGEPAYFRIGADINGMQGIYKTIAR